MKQDLQEVSVQQIRSFRLHSHHLDAIYSPDDVEEITGASGIINSPPGSWETAMHVRVPSLTLSDIENLLNTKKSLVQAWSLRGAPAIFPVADSGAFLSALVAKPGEAWIYTKGIKLALDFLQTEFETLFALMLKVMPQLDNLTVTSKSQLDRTIANWMQPLLPPAMQDSWNEPSMYGYSESQIVGDSIVSFMLRPCAFLGLVVFADRQGISPTFTSFKNWVGQALEADAEAEKQLVRKFLHCYGPATVGMLVSWLGCSGQQGKRLWQTVSDEIEPVKSLDQKAFILSVDKEQLFSEPSFTRELLLLGGHDPYLDCRDRLALLPDPSHNQLVWRTVTNPGVVLQQGEIIGVWTGLKKSKGIEAKISLWAKTKNRKQLQNLAEEYAAFRQQKLVSVEIE